MLGVHMSGSYVVADRRRRRWGLLAEAGRRRRRSPTAYLRYLEPQRVPVLSHRPPVALWDRRGEVEAKWLLHWRRGFAEVAAALVPLPPITL